MNLKLHLDLKLKQRTQSLYLDCKQHYKHDCSSCLCLHWLGAGRASVTRLESIVKEAVESGTTTQLARSNHTATIQLSIQTHHHNSLRSDQTAMAAKQQQRFLPTPFARASRTAVRHTTLSPLSTSLRRAWWPARYMFDVAAEGFLHLSTPLWNTSRRSGAASMFYDTRGTSDRDDNPTEPPPPTASIPLEFSNDDASTDSGLASIPVHIVRS